jgi:hypothetical protein
MMSEATMQSNPAPAVPTSSRQRGAALIITVIVIMVLSILGMSMVTFTSTEERTATSYRDGLQARATAEAGIHVVEEMFRDPTNRRIVPLFSATAANCGAGTADYCGTTEANTETSLNAIGIWRASRLAPILPAKYTGITNRFFLGPFRDAWGQTFGGTYNSTAANDIYDLKFNCTNPATNAVVADANCWLQSKINSALLNYTAATPNNYNANTGKITDISFYAAPSAGGYQYGICTVRVTAVKLDQNNNVVARETLEAVIGDAAKKPAVFGNGPVSFNVNLCGDGCEQIFANGDASITGGTIGGGQDPILTVGPPGTSASPTGSHTAVVGTPLTSPKINPWDLAYKPTTAAGLAKYYLVAARALDAAWTDNDINTPSAADRAPRPCGVNLLALCQDYNLEYAAGATPAVKAARTSASVPKMYKWNIAAQEWTECGSGTTLNGCVLAPTFTVTPVNDLSVPSATDAAGRVDNADIPYNKTRVAKTQFEITNDQDGATLLVDGTFYKHGNLTGNMSVITVGSFHLHSNTQWAPALENKVMWIAGRDIFSHSDCCAPSNTCATNLTHPEASGIMACHEQFKTDSQNATLGVILAENAVNLAINACNTCDEVNSTTALDNTNGDHGSLCGLPEWPWTMPTIPKILSLKSVAD